jgi:hypothetical protein
MNEDTCEAQREYDLEWHITKEEHATLTRLMVPFVSQIEAVFGSRLEIVMANMAALWLVNMLADGGMIAGQPVGFYVHQLVNELLMERDGDDARLRLLWCD